jgi:hypothetical protein
MRECSDKQTEWCDEQKDELSNVPKMTWIEDKTPLFSDNLAIT